MQSRLSRSGVAFLTACAFIIQAPGPECWAASVRVLARPAAVGLPAAGVAWTLRPGPGFAWQTAPVRLTTPGLAAPSAPVPELAHAPFLAAPAAALPAAGPSALVPAGGVQVQAEASSPQAPPEYPLQSQLAAAAEGGLRGEDAGASLSRLFDGVGPQADGPRLAGPVGEEPQGPRPSGLGRAQSDEEMVLADPAPPEPARPWLAVVREMVFGQPEISPLVRPYRLQMNIARGMLIFKAVLNTALAYSIGGLVDAAIAHTLPAAGLWLGALASLVVAKAVNQRFYSITAGKLRIRVRSEVRAKLFAGLVRLSDAGEDPGRLAARLTSDVTRVTVKNVSIPIQFPHLVIQSVLATFFVVKASPLMAAVILGSLPLLGWLAWRYGRRSAALQERAATESASLTQTGTELLTGAPLPEGQRAPAVARYRGIADRFERTMTDFIGLGANFDSIREVLQAACTELLVLGVGLVSFILTGAPSVGQVMSLRGYAKDLRGAVDGLTDAYTDSKDAEGGTRRIMELLRRIQSDPEGSAEPPAGR